MSALASTATAQQDCGTVLHPGETIRARALLDAGMYELPDGIAGGLPHKVPLTFHVVRTSAGIGGIPQTQLDQAVADANSAYAGAGMSFCVQGSIDYIDSDAFYFDIDTSDEINALRMTNVVPLTINVYFTPNLNSESGSLCGRSSFTFSQVQGIVMKNSCTGLSTNPSTFPHEIGHYFDLFHTHESSFGIECVNGTNCSVAGDLLCDTPADPNISGQVNTSCQYVGGAPGPCGGDPPYNPDPTNYMSYSLKVCRTYFSVEQNSKALATLVNLRPELVSSHTDCNNNTVCDVQDILDGTSHDFDGNGIPDECKPQQANDSCITPLAVSEGSFPFTTLGASTDGLPLFCTGGGGGGAFDDDTWFLYSPSATGDATFSTCNDADFDSRVAVYFEAPCPPSGPLACSDDAVGCGLTSELTLLVTPLINYLVRVGATTGGGSGTLTISMPIVLPCPWDIDGDGTVGITDFLALLAAWGPNPGHPADFDSDGIVGITDFLDLLAHWGPCP